MYMYTNCADGAVLHHLLDCDRWYLIVMADKYGVPCVGLGCGSEEVPVTKGVDLRAQYPDKWISNQALRDYYAAVIKAIYSCVAQGNTYIDMAVIQEQLLPAYLDKWPNKDSVKR